MTPTVEELDAGLPALEEHLVAALPGCAITRYAHYLLVELAGASSAVRTREQADRAVAALREQQARRNAEGYSALFDALWAVHAADRRQTIQLHGSAAGTALEAWAAARGLDVVSEVRSCVGLPHPWTTLRLVSPDPLAIGYLVVVHLDCAPQTVEASS